MNQLFIDAFHGVLLVFLFVSGEQVETHPPSFVLPTVCQTYVKFSPRGGSQDMLVKALNESKEHLYVAIYSITAPGVVQALQEAHKRGVNIYAKADQTQSSGKAQKDAIRILSDSGVIIMVSKLRRTLHDKFVVVDSKVVLTGSFNWTNNAELNNRENIVRLECPALAKQYEEEWKTIE